MPRTANTAPSPRARRAARGAALTRFDSNYYKRPGVALLAGVDEAGRGALAGPVCAAVVVLERACRLPAVDDSKVLREALREALFDDILRCARAVGVGWASAEEVDRINVLEATCLAARRALDALVEPPDLVLADALKPQKLRREGVACPIESLIDGDARSRAIAAASIIAKVSRDRLMRRLDAEYPEYGFAGHKGYGARSHLEALQSLGPTTLHRHSFQGVDFFDRPYRRSRTLEALLGELHTSAGAHADPAEVWRARADHLPETEQRIYFEAWEARRNDA